MKAAEKMKSPLNVISGPPRKLFKIELSLTYKNVPMTRANVSVMHYAKDAKTAREEMKQYAELKLSGIKEIVNPKK